MSTKDAVKLDYFNAPRHSTPLDFKAYKSCNKHNVHTAYQLRDH